MGLRLSEPNRKKKQPAGIVICGLCYDHYQRIDKCVATKNNTWWVALESSVFRRSFHRSDWKWSPSWAYICI